jgi:hypothetical protein
LHVLTEKQYMQQILLIRNCIYLQENDGRLLRFARNDASDLLEWLINNYI